MENNKIFDLIKSNNFNEIITLLKTKKITSIDIRDDNYNYFIQYIVNFNKIDILSLLLEMSKKSEITFRIDILDTDGRTLLYNCIKHNNIEILKLLIDANNNNIGISIIDIEDRLGLTALHYSVIFNNFEAFQILLDNKADPNIRSKDGSNVFITCLKYKRNTMIEYFIDKNYNFNFTTNEGNTILQVAVNFQNNDIIKKLLNSKINLNNVSSDYGLSVLHQSIIMDNYDLFIKLLEKNVNINLSDFYGNTPLHYILMEKRHNYLDKFINLNDIKYNVSNINGDLPLHILLNNDDGELSKIDDSIIEKIIINTDLNLQNNDGISCLIQLVNKNMIYKFRKVLLIKPLNIFIDDRDLKTMKINEELLDIFVESYYNQIKNNKDDLILDWEKWCANDLIDKLKTLAEAVSDSSSQKICHKKIKSVIVKEKRSLPKLINLDLKLDNGIFTNFCFYTGTTVDILFGLILLRNDFKSIKLNLILDYPLTLNQSLEAHYKKIGLDYPYKLDFSNIEIVWSYQKIFYPSYFDEEVEKKLKESDYITIPIGIETSIGSHANILFWDVKNKTVERFEPNGSTYPMGLNYNPELLDNLLESKLKQFDEDIKYIPPYMFLPPIGFQLLENLETEKCRKIGDPNGFCGVWCIWWVYQRMLNLTNSKLNLNNIAYELIKYIKLDNQSFKTIIRNFSKKITHIRDTFLKKENIDINDWMVGNYTLDNLNNIEKNVLKIII